MMITRLRTLMPATLRLRHPTDVYAELAAGASYVRRIGCAGLEGVLEFAL